MKVAGRSPLLASLVFVVVAQSPSVANARDAGVRPNARTPGQAETSNPPIPEALRREQTSSPRQTLTRFLANSRAAIEDVIDDGVLSEDGLWHYLRATNALDFSTTPHGGAPNVQSERAVLLREILDRVPLPPAEEIPGDREVADGAIERWAIPGTQLEIVRIDSGPRKGEFLFSSHTVERLRSLYRMVRDHPGKAGSLAGYYEASAEEAAARGRLIRNRLKGVDLSSPRSTFDGFLDSVNRAYRLVMEADAAMNVDPPTMSRSEAAEVDVKARNLLRRAIGTLDMSQVPLARRQQVGIETAIQLKEIVDRLALPPVTSIPGQEEVRAARRGEGRKPLRADEPFRWVYPSTEIEIVERMEGERQGDFFFSPESVARIHADFLAVRDLPYRVDLSGSALLQYLSPEKSEGFYEYYASTPGYLVPGASFLGALVDRLPGWTQAVYADQTLWQWAGVLLCVLMIALLGVAIWLLVIRLASGTTELFQRWLRIFPPLIVAALVALGVRFVDEDLNATSDVLIFTTVGGALLVTLMLALFAAGVCQAIAETIIRFPRIPDEGINASLLRIGARIVGFLIAIVIVIEGVRELGLDAIPLLAGLGVGGLAVALAAQKTVANFLGSLILFANKPVRVGDFCAYGDGKVGTIEEINILSTRIRTLERSVVTIPNADFCEMELDNYTMRYERRLKTVLQLRYETTPEQLRYVLAELRRLLLSHPMVNPDPARVRFVEYGEYSLKVEVYTYIRTDDHDTFLAVQEDLLLRIADIVREAGTGFALPSRTAYIARDDGIDGEQGRTAQARVHE